MAAEIIGGVYIKHINKDKSLFKQLNSWGIREDTFEKEIKPAATTIRLIEDTEGITYEVPVRDFKRLCMKKRVNKPGTDLWATVMLLHRFYFHQYKDGKLIHTGVREVRAEKRTAQSKMF